MNASQTWLDTWKTKAENRRQLLSQVVSRKPVNPAVASIRDQYLKRTHAAVSNRKERLQAYVAHLQGVANIIAPNQSSGGSSGSKGSLGDSA